MPGREGVCYTDLQEALNNTEANDVVWLEDGYEYAPSSSKADIGANYGYACVKTPNVIFTLRSASGEVDLGAGKGATISGAKDPDSTYADGRGRNAVRPLWVQNSGTILQGLILENGSTADTAQTSGGAVHGGGIFTNCLFRGNAAPTGGAIGNANAVVYNCVFTNNFAFQTYYGGGAISNVKSCYDSFFIDNGAEKQGGAIFCQWTASSYYFSNCTFKANWSKAMGGAFCIQKGQTVMDDCKVLDNEARSGDGGGVQGKNVMTRCLIAGNTSNGCGGGAIGRKDDYAVLYRCTVSNNTAISGGGIRYANVCDSSVIVANRAVGNSNGSYGAGAYDCRLDKCKVIGNMSTNDTYGGNATFGGGGLSGCSATNCLIAGNVVFAPKSATGSRGAGANDSDLFNCIVSNNCCTGRGSGVYGGGRTLYNCLIIDNYSTLESGYHWIGAIAGDDWKNESQTIKAVNCTIVRNRLLTPTRHPGACRASLFNCILDDDGEDPLCEIFIASNCCCKITNADVLKSRTLDHATYHFGNLNCNPKLKVDYRPGYPVKNKGLYYPWMDDENDVRSKDLAGGPRILGTAPDLGCYEPPIPGLMLLVK